MEIVLIKVFVLMVEGLMFDILVCKFEGVG